MGHFVHPFRCHLRRTLIFKDEKFLLNILDKFWSAFFRVFAKGKLICEGVGRLSEWFRMAQIISDGVICGLYGGQGWFESVRNNSGERVI